MTSPPTGRSSLAGRVRYAGNVARATQALLIATAFCAALGGEQQPPRFEDFPVKEAFKGKPAPPTLIRPLERRYRTVIREGVSKGYGVRDQESGRERPGPNFAGRFIVVEWGCGSNCSQYAIVDAASGDIFQPPVLGKRIEYFDAGYLEFRLNSRLMVSKTNCAMGSYDACDRDYFVWGGRKFRHVLSRRQKEP